MDEPFFKQIEEPESFDPNIEPQRIISIEKFIVLSVLSLGLYELWWIYKAWRFFKQKENADTIPALRAIFSVFYLYFLLKKILYFAQGKGYETEYPSEALYACFVLTNLLSRLPEPYFLISVTTFIFLLPPFRAFNFALRNSPEVEVIEETVYSPRQILLVICGALLWSSLLLGLSGQLDLPAE